ncbi:MAG: L,D-transpeptidase [Acidiferrobacterales bacterium]|nr:L,D-transpeptidase [Acidiferrobacterales bacterium]
MREHDGPATQVEINIASQTLAVVENCETTHIFSVSTAGNGAGEENGSFCTPRGMHIIRAKIGHDAPANTVFIGRRPSGEIYHPELRQKYPDRDWILTRILWLSGCEPGRNRLGSVDTMRRYVYIHGTPDEVEMGVPGSHGCIRMRNQEVIFLFDLLKVGTPVLIDE